MKIANNYLIIIEFLNKFVKKVAMVPPLIFFLHFSKLEDLATVIDAVRHQEIFKIGSEIHKIFESIFPQYLNEVIHMGNDAFICSSGVLKKLFFKFTKH